LLICLRTTKFPIWVRQFHCFFFLVFESSMCFCLVTRYVHDTYAHFCVWNTFNHTYYSCPYIKCKQSYVMHVHCAKGLTLRMIYAFFSMPCTWGMGKRYMPTQHWFGAISLPSMFAQKRLVSKQHDTMIRHAYHCNSIECFLFGSTY
jgi:hypothetical protein